MSATVETRATHHVIFLPPIRGHEAAVYVIHDVGRPPVQVRADRRHIRGCEGGHDQTEKSVGEEHEHSWIGQVVADDGGIDVRKRGGEVTQGRIYDQRGQCDKNPRPWPNRVMRHIKPECGLHRVLLVLRCQHALCSVSTASGLGSRGTRCSTTVQRSVR